MITKLFLTLFVSLFLFSISTNVLAAAINDLCEVPSGISNKVANSHVVCGDIDKENAHANNEQRYSDDVEKEAREFIRLSKRRPSIAESLMAIFFIPGLVLLWFSRFSKSSK